MRVPESAPDLAAKRSVVEKAILASGLLTEGDHIVVAASGGPDSTALILASSALAKTLDLHLTVATLDHGMRPASDVAADIDFVRQLSDRLDLPFITARRDGPRVAAQLGQGPEAAMRRVRYAWLAQVARQVGASTVATGHTRDDLAETVLMRLVTGSGLDGLRAITPASAWPLGVAEIARIAQEPGAEMARLEPESAGEMAPPIQGRVDDMAHEASELAAGARAWPPRLVRPLLTVSRADIMAYVTAFGLVPRHDLTNEDPTFLRNRVRLGIVPLLEHLNPQVRTALARLAASAADDLVIVDAAADEAWRQVVQSTIDPICIDRPAFKALGRALQRRILRRAVLALGGDTRAWGWERLEEARMWAMTGRTGGLMTLPGKMWLLVEREEMVLTRGERPARRRSAEADE